MTREKLETCPLGRLPRVLFQHQHIESVHEDAVAAVDVAMRLLTRERGGAECDASFPYRLLYMLHGIEQDRGIEPAGNTELGGQVERRNDHVIDAIDLADVFDAVDGGLGLDEEAAYRLRPAFGQIVMQLDALTPRTRRLPLRYVPTET
jgi:hypothetical protein